jgi:NAD(P)-dependent dehydrogenase (short-subunit alcohol dehydrogenase family)
MFRLDDRVALVTGAGSGLGRRFAQTLAAAGASVVLGARRADRLEETADLIRCAGGRARSLPLDVTDSQSVQNAFRVIREEVGVADIIVNNAGVSRSSFLADLSEEDWDDVIDTNLKGVFFVAREAARELIEAGKPGSVINIASILAYRVSKTLSAYIAAKNGVVGLTQAMALEWARHGIRVNAIAPGYFRSEITEKYFATIEGEKMLKQVPMRRIGLLEELDGPLLLLASGAGSFMTGSTVTVDGGHLVSSL